MLPTRDAELVQILDRSLADASDRARKQDGSSWLACRPGCNSCCYGVFRISWLDAERLRSALEALRIQDPDAAHAIQQRAHTITRNLSSSFPGDDQSGTLSDDAAAWDAFADLAETDLPCPVLDPASGSCGLYAGRPLTCRVFGPPVQNEAGIGMCELCYVGASETEIFYGEMHLQHHQLEMELLQEHREHETVIAWALRP